MLYPVINDLHDLSDLQILQKRKSKDGAKITNVITTATGEAPTGTMRRSRLSVLTQDAGQNAVTKQPDSFYDVTLGAYEKLLKKGESMEQFKSESPSVAEQNFWEYLTARICAGVGISKLLVLPSSMQGTVVRADLDIATAFFRSRSEVMATAILNIYEWTIGWAARYDQQMDGAPKGDLLSATIRPPRSVNVEFGRNSSAMISEVQAGLRTRQDVYAEAGLDWREELEQIAKEAAFIQALSVKYTVPVSLIAAPAQTAVQATTEPDSDDTKADGPVKIGAND
jgi:capsid protein